MPGFSALAGLCARFLRLNSPPPPPPPPPPTHKQEKRNRRDPVRPGALLLSIFLFSATIPSIVADDHGNDSSSATAVDIPSTTAGTLDAGDQDFFRIDIGEAGSLTLEGSGTTDTYGILYDADGTELARDDDGGTGQNFRISRDSLQPGTYHLLLRAFGPAISGDYSLTVSGSAQPPTGDAFQSESASAGEASSTADDHGDDPATATPLAIPSTTAGEIGAGDKDYFRIDVVVAGFLTFETTGSTDTYGTLYDSDGAVIDEDNDRGPRPNNFRITDALVLEGSYFLEVRGASLSRDTGPYELRMNGDARGPGTPAATAPSVSIHAIPSGDEETTVQLGATLTGGAYDGAVDYAWSVDGGTLNSSSSATPTWTRPAVNSNTNHTVRLTVTVRGTGTNAESGTSDTASANREALVRDVPPPLPAADAPSVTINPIPNGNENTTVRLGATLTGGTYDGTPEFAWTVTGGRLSNPNSATPTWTRPTLNADADYTVRLTVTVRGRGTNARSGTSERVNASRTARVLDVPVQLPVAAAPSVSINAIPAGNEGTAVQLAATLNGGTYDGALDYAWTVTGGTLDDPAAATPTWTRPSVTSNTNFTVRLTVTARGAGTVARSGTSDTANATFSALVRNVVVVLPVAAAPSVTINAIPAGDENTNVQLAATLNGGTYDGAVEYAWSVNGGALDSSSSATPTWARPSVTSNTNHTVSLTITVRGSGTTARSGTSETANTTRTAQVRDTGGTTGDHGNDRASATTVGIPSTTTGTITAGDRDYFRIDVSQAGSLRLRTTGNTDTYGTLFDSGGSKITEDDDSGPPRRNFLIVQGSVDVGTHYLEVRGWGRRTAGDYTLEVTGTARSTGTQLPAASAPSVTINAVPAGDEGTGVQLGAALTGGAYDGAPDYTWSVSGGTLDNANLATPTWTRPAVNADANHTVSLTVSVKGSGANASNGSSDTASTSRSAQVRNVVAPLPVAAAPTVSIDTIPAGNENTTVQLAATLNGGTYDGAVEYAWTVTGGTLNDPAAATPTWTRPSVTSNTNHTVRLTVTARGAGTVARNGSSDTANTTFSALVRNVVVVLPVAAAPSVTINAIPAGNENTTVRLGATLAGGGPYDGAVEYNWSVNGGTLDNANSATPNWTRPSVTSNTNHTVSLTITVRGSGATARNSSSDTASTTRSAQVRDSSGDHGNDRASATTVTIPSTTAGTLTRNDRDYFRIEIGQAGSLRLETTSGIDTYGTLFDSGGSEITRNDDGGNNFNFRISRFSIGAGVYYLEVRGFQPSSTGVYSLEVSGTARNTGTQLPAASAPSVTINSIPAGDEGTDVQLGAALTGGTYDGTPDYTWSVSDGALDNANVASPTWTRPTVNADANHTISLTVSVDGSGTNASSGTSDTASTSQTAQVQDVPLQLPPAAAPSVSINTIPAGNEGADVQLSAALGSGTYDGAVEYQWSVDGGVLDNANAATPTWTRPSVTSNTNHTVSLTITVRGTGTTARNGTSDTANTSRSAQVRNVVVLPMAAAPTVSIDAIPAGNENTAVQLGATLSGGGAYDGAVEYDWSVNGGVLNDSTLATPTWTRPSVSSDSSRTVSLTVTVRGAGTAASNGTSDTASTSLTAQVRDAGDHGNDQASATRVAIPSTTAGTLTSRDRDYFRIEVGQAGSLRLETTSGLDTYGTLLRSDGSQVTRNDDSGSNNNFRISMGSIGAGVYYLQVRGFHHTTIGPYNLEVSGTARGPGGLPAASAPTVSIDSIPAGDEGTAVQLAAALVGGTYDGAVDYTWSVSGGVLDNANLAAPTWTRPAVNADTNHTISLTVSVDGSGANASSGTSDTASTSQTAQVRNVVVLPVAAAPSVTINAIPAGDEGTAVQLGATLTGGGPYDGAVEYDWSVNGGTLDNANSATPNWTRPSVSSDSSHTVSLTVTVLGTGATARNGTSDTASTSRDALVRNDTGTLPAAATPAVSINAIADGDEATSVQLSATMNGGDYDGTPEYAWSVTRGTLANPNSATPTWTRPRVASDTNHTVRLTVTVRGDGTAALDGTSDSQSASLSTQVRDTGGAGDDHGNNRADASPVSIPSTTTANIGRSDRDYYRIDVAHAGSLRLQTRGRVDTVGTLQRSNGSAIASNDDGGQAQNFHIFRNSVDVGVYYLEVRGYSNSSASRGDYTLEVTGTARGADSLPSAAAPSVTINAIADGDEGAAVQLGAVLTGGTYDGAVDYAWSVDGGTLDDSTLATPTWTRPVVTSDTNHTASLIVTVQGSGTNAASGTSATANASRTALVRNVTTALPVAAAPAVTINAIAAGDEGSTVQLGAALSGGTYDGAVDYAWTATGGTLANADTATPTWTRPAVNANTNYTLRLTVTARGAGTNARNGTSATANTSRTAQVRNLVQLPVAAAPSVTIDAIPAGDEGYTVQLGANVTGGTYDGAVDYTWTATGGTLANADSATPTWTRPSVGANTNHTVRLTITVRGSGTAARNGTSDTASTSALATVRDIPQLTVTTLASNLTIPWDLAFTPDGTMLFTERGGKLSARLTDGTVQVVTADFSDVYAVGESGLMAIVTDPDFTTNRRFYTCQAHTGPEVQVIAWTIDSGYTAATRAADPLVGGIPAKAGSGRHSGCRLRFGPDGHLWIATGDAAIGSTPQDMNSLGGKVLRVNPSTGAGVAGNPFAAAPQIYSFGHRNIQGLALRPGTREMWVVEHGPYTDDEINLLAAGGNYGWGPTYQSYAYYEGVPMTDLTRFPSAVPAKWLSGTPTLATSGGIFLEGDAWRGWEGRLAVASLKERSLRLFEFSADGDFVSQVNVSALSGTYGRLRTPMLGPDGALYVTTSNGSAEDKILRIEAGDGTSVQRADAAAPSVSIEAIADGDENTTVQLGAMLGSGIYDGAAQYAWTVSGGTLDDHTAAAPTWTRPSVISDANHTVSLTIIVRGSGTNARSGTSDRANTSRLALVRNVLPVAAAPSVTINAIPAGNEDATVQLGATLTGGAYDGAVEYDWSVNGGSLDDDSAAAPTWTRPSVTSNTNHTVSLTITVRGAGTTARSGTSDTVSTTRTAQVLNNTGVLPTAAAPAVSINGIENGDEDTTAQLSATLTGGDYDGTPEYAWSVTGGTLANPNSATPAWTRPKVASNINHTVRLTVTVRGAGTAARNGTSDTRSASGLAQVRDIGGTGDDHSNNRANATPVSIPSTTVASLGRNDRDYYRIHVAHAGSLRLQTRGRVDTFGTLQRSNGATIASNDGGGERYNFRIIRDSVDVGVYYLEVRGYNGAIPLAPVRGDYVLEVTGSARSSDPLPPAVAPAVTIEAIPAGDEYTGVSLSAMLAGGTYDGAPGYAWFVDGGELDDASSATPTWTRPAVTADANHNVSLTIAVGVEDTNAGRRTRDTATTSRLALVRDVQSPLPPATAPTVSIDAIPAGDEGTAVQLGATLNGGTYDSAPEYAWTVDGGMLANANSATPTWTRPTVNADANHNVRLTVTVLGTGTVARTDAHAAASASRSALVRSLPVASAPTVSINPIAPGDEGTTVQLGAALQGGTYDGALTFAWAVTSGTLDDPTSATPTWTRPLVDEIGVTELVSLRVTAQGAGTNARSGTSDMSRYISYRASVLDVGDAIAAVDHGDDRVSATSVEIPSLIAGELGPGDKDYFHIGVWYGELTLETIGATDTYGTLYDSAGNVVASNDDKGLGSNFRIHTESLGSFDDPGGDDYFLEVRGYDDSTTGAYSLSVTSSGEGTNSPSGNGDDHGDDRESATTLTLPGPIYGQLGHLRDQDFFQFNLASSSFVVAEIESYAVDGVEGELYNQSGQVISSDEYGEHGFKLGGELVAGDYFVAIRGDADRTRGAYKLTVTENAASPPTVDSDKLPSAQTATAGGAALALFVNAAFSDPDNEYVWLAPASDNPSVATVALEGPALVVNPHTVGTATITVTGSDATGRSVAGSFAVTVSASTRSDPTASFNAAGDRLTLSFDDQFAPGETRAYQARVRQKSPRGGWNRFCFSATNSGATTQTQNVSTDLTMTGIAEPGVAYETVYRHIGNSCSGTRDELWSRVVEATTPGTASFDIEVVYDSPPTDAMRAAVEWGVQYWERILTMSLPNVDFSSEAGYCGGVVFRDVIDDMRLYVEVDRGGGSGTGGRGSAGACVVRSTSGLPAAGSVTLYVDENDLSANSLRRLILHEITHALGFSRYRFHSANLLRNPSLLKDGSDALGAPDTHFVGQLAVAAFNAAGGSSYSGGKVPIWNAQNRNRGVQDSHWRDTVFGNEVMGSSTDHTSKLSAITIQAMADLGYHVDVSQAESYTLPSAFSNLFPNAIRTGGAPGESDGHGHEHSHEEIDEEWCVVEDATGTVNDGWETVLKLDPGAVRTRVQ